jgi:hypothetical protein
MCPFANNLQSDIEDTSCRKCADKDSFLVGGENSVLEPHAVTHPTAKHGNALQTLPTVNAEY